MKRSGICLPPAVCQIYANTRLTKIRCFSAGRCLPGGSKHIPLRFILKFATQTLTLPYQIGAIISQINQDFQKATVFYFLHIELVEEFGESGDIVRAVGFNYIMAAGNDL